MNVTLWGAYHRSLQPLEQLGLAIHLSFDGRGEPAAVIEAEGLVSGADARATTRLSGALREYTFDFRDGLGKECVLVLAGRSSGSTLREWTELVGPLLVAGEVAGRATVRLDYRDVPAWRLVALLEPWRLFFKY